MVRLYVLIILEKPNLWVFARLKISMTTTEQTAIALPSDQYWDMIIEPKRSLFDLCLGELWKYRDLVMLFVRRVTCCGYTRNDTTGSV